MVWKFEALDGSGWLWTALDGSGRLSLGGSATKKSGNQVEGSFSRAIRPTKEHHIGRSAFVQPRLDINPEQFFVDVDEGQCLQGVIPHVQTVICLNVPNQVPMI